MKYIYAKGLGSIHPGLTHLKLLRKNNYPTHKNRIRSLEIIPKIIMFRFAIFSARGVRDCSIEEETPFEIQLAATVEYDIPPGRRHVELKHRHPLDVRCLQLVRLQLVGFCFYGTALFYLVAAVRKIVFLNGIGCLEVVRVRGDSRAKDNTTLGACCRCHAEVFHESRESTYLQSTTLQLVQAKCLVPASVGLCQAPPGPYDAKDARGALCPAKPRCRILNHVCVPEARVPEIMMAKATAPS